MLHEVLVRGEWPGWNFIVFFQGDESYLLETAGPHVPVLFPLLIGHIQAAASAVDVPGGSDLEPPGTVWQWHWLHFLLPSEATWFWGCS